MDNGISTATVQELKDYNIKLLNQLLRSFLSVCSYKNTTFDISNENKQTILMNGQFADLSLSGGFTWPNDFTWYDTNNNAISMTALEAVYFATTVFTYTQKCYVVYNTHKTNIDNLTTVSEVQEYDVNLNWPVYEVDYTDTTGSILYINSRRPQVDIISCGSNTLSYCNTTSTSYTTIRRFNFRGTNNTGSPSSIRAVGYVNNASNNAQIRIQDITNSKTICQSATFKNTTSAIIDLGAISNLPENEAIFDIQIKTSSSSYSTYLHSVNIYF